MKDLHTIKKKTNANLLSSPKKRSRSVKVPKRPVISAQKTSRSVKVHKKPLSSD